MILPAVAAGLALAASAAGLDPARAAAIEAAIESSRRDQGIPGLTAAIAVDGRLVWIKGFGEADVENRGAAGPQTVYRLGSISKPITAVAAMQLAERGILDLDADVRTLVPGFPKKAWPITPRQLLAHLGGIRHYQGDEWDSTRRYVSLLEGLDVFKDDPLVHEPGTRYLYTTHGYTLLGAVLEAASGRRFVELLRESVFGPAGMGSARDDDRRALIPNRARGYAGLADGGIRNADPADTSYKVPGGGLVATAGDVARFGAAFLGDRLIRPEARAAMLTRQKTRDGQALGYGLGWTLGDSHGRAEAWHTGGQQGVSNIVYLRPGSALVIVLLSNLEEAPTLDLARWIADLVQP